MARRGRTGWTWRAAVAPLATLAAVVALAAGCSSGDDDAGADGDDARTVQPGAPGDETRELSDDESSSITAPEHTDLDTAFMQDMIIHHHQALEMAALVEDRTERDDLPTLAQRITETQETEIGQLEDWLTERDEDVPSEEDIADHASHTMPGMATPDQIEELEAARGEAFDRLFLDLMITHHQGAVAMVIQLYEDGGGVEPAADRVARDAEADQNIEINRMQELLDEL